MTTREQAECRSRRIRARNRHASRRTPRIAAIVGRRPSRVLAERRSSGSPSLLAVLSLLLCLPGVLDSPGSRNLPPSLWAVEPEGSRAGASEPPAGAEAGASVDVPDEIDTAGMVRLSKKNAIWIDRKRKWVVMDGRVCLKRGTLEMFACLTGTKEHESVVAVEARAFEAHAALVAVGAKPGKPAVFTPKYEPASGTEIDVWVLWKDADGKPRRARARDWVRNTRTKESLSHPWVFSGSSFWKDPRTGQSLYQADAGDFICVSNFPTATMDLTIESSQAEGEWLFEAFTERIPEPKTPVRLVLVPRTGSKSTPDPRPR
ncbi:MAG: hypothetical protein FJ297_09935 [Planctomycetes bacterium]|nr:hypothetical protein [Planctomycetota bacterium]